MRLHTHTHTHTPTVQVVVIAKVLEARPSFNNLFGLLRPSPSKTTLQAPPSPLNTQGGGVTPRRTSLVMDAASGPAGHDQGEGGLGAGVDPCLLAIVNRAFSNR